MNIPEVLLIISARSGAAAEIKREIVLRISEKRHWSDFWDESGDVREVYDNEGRVSRHYSSVSDLNGIRVLEVGAGTGRDSPTRACSSASNA